MILAIDAGNSRTKWAVFAWGGEQLQHGNWPNDSLAQQVTPVEWAACHRIIICNVAGLAVSRRLQDMLQAVDAPIHWLRSSTAAAGVLNRYADPESLGMDRWAAIVGAWHEFREPCVVVGAGTALTADRLKTDSAGKQGIFAGGSIAPGLQLMINSLLQNTHGVQSYEGQLSHMPLSTGDAVHSGIAFALCGPVLAILKAAEAEGELPRVVLSGGDASLLQQALAQFQIENRMDMVDNLVLKGLYHLERECL